MHLGAYGQAYFAAETMEIVSGEARGGQGGARICGMAAVAVQHRFHLGCGHDVLRHPLSCASSLSVPCAAVPLLCYHHQTLMTMITWQA
jgi:hypothetical protein